MPRPPHLLTDSADAYEDATEVYFDPIDEEGTPDCECTFFAYIAPMGSGEPVAQCIHCGRLAK